MKEEDYETTRMEVTQVIYNNDLNLKVEEIAATKNYELNYLYNTLYLNINIHQGPFLKRLVKGTGEREKFLLERIESELNML